MRNCCTPMNRKKFAASQVRNYGIRPTGFAPLENVLDTVENYRIYNRAY